MDNNLKRDKFKERFVVNDIKEANDELLKKMQEEKRMNEIINMVDNNPQMLNNLSITKLEKINKLYDKKIEELDKKIEKLKKSDS